MDKNRVFEIARDAVEKLVAERGATATFAFDEIWQYGTEEVPSSQRPGPHRRLVSEGYIEETGAKTRATTRSRAGSTTTEYRPGRRYRRTDEGQTLATALKHLQKAMDAKGLIIKPVELANFYLTLKTTPIVILAGLSGTGKSWLPRMFSELIGANFALISVQPQWSDNADLFGYTSSLNPSRFVEGRFTKALLDAVREDNVPMIVLLDEMNLAAIEHYFSDFLSIVETRRKESGAVTTDPLPLDLPILEGDDDPYQHLRGMALPPNARVIGTANIDETTRLFSPKVIDRAFVIEFDDIDLTVFPSPAETEFDDVHFEVLAESLIDSGNPISPLEVRSDSEELFDHISSLLEEIRQILRPAGISFGYRTRDAILLYMWHWKVNDLANLMTIEAAFDFCVLQKILPKITGSGEALLIALQNLSAWLNKKRELEPSAAALEESGAEVEEKTSFGRSSEKVNRMLERLEFEGATTYWGI